MDFAQLWSSLSNAPPPPSSSEGATLCEIQSLLVSLQTTFDGRRDNDGGNIASQAKTFMNKKRNKTFREIT